mgnify:CR=1 FL=1
MFVQRLSSLIAASLLLALAQTAWGADAPAAPAAPSAPSTVVVAAPATAPAAAPASLDNRIQDLKGDVIKLNRDLLVLEEELLFPANTQVAVFVSMDVGDFFDLDSVQLRIDDKPVSNYLYTEREVAALLRAGQHLGGALRRHRLLRAQDIVRRASFENLLFGTSEELACRQHIRDAAQGVRSLLETADETARVIGHKD